MKLPPGETDKRGLTWTCGACRSTFMLEPMAAKQSKKGGREAEITRCSMRRRDGDVCGLRYWHAGGGYDQIKIRQGIDPAWLENAAGA